MNHVLYLQSFDYLSADAFNPVTEAFFFPMASSVYTRDLTMP